MFYLGLLKIDGCNQPFLKIDGCNCTRCTRSNGSPAGMCALCLMLIAELIFQRSYTVRSITNCTLAHGSDRTFLQHCTLLKRAHFTSYRYYCAVCYAHSGYITVVEPYQLLCYWSNFSKLLLAGWFEVRLRSYNFHSAKQPMI